MGVGTDGGRERGSKQTSGAQGEDFLGAEWCGQLCEKGDFQLNSHLSTLANIHKIYHTLNKLNLPEDVGQEDHQTQPVLIVKKKHISLQREEVQLHPPEHRHKLSQLGNLDKSIIQTHPLSETSTI